MLLFIGVGPGSFEGSLYIELGQKLHNIHSVLQRNLNVFYFNIMFTMRAHERSMGVNGMLNHFILEHLTPIKILEIVQKYYS